MTMSHDQLGDPFDSNKQPDVALPPKPDIVGPNGKPLKRDAEPERARHNTNGRFISSPKRDRSRRNKARWAAMRAEQAEHKYQAERARQIEEAFKSGGFAAAQKMADQLLPDSISEALDKRRRKR